MSKVFEIMSDKEWFNETNIARVLAQAVGEEVVVRQLANIQEDSTPKESPKKKPKKVEL